MDKSFRDFGNEDMGKVVTFLAAKRRDWPVVFKTHTGSPTGYAQSATYIIRAMVQEGINVFYQCLNEANEYEGSSGDELVDALHLYPGDLSMPQIVYSLASLFYHNSGAYKIGWTMMEVFGCPSIWLPPCNMMDEVWVPTPLQKAGFIASGVEVPVHVVPLCVDPWWFNPEIKAGNWWGEESFIFMFNGWWAERKGIDVLVDAFLREFRGSKDVCLLIKTMGSPNQKDKMATLRHYRGRRYRPRVYLVDGAVPLAYLGGLYRMCHAFVYAGYGEGWGMPMQEALMCGLPVVATDALGVGEILRDPQGQVYPGVRLVKSYPDVSPVEHPYYHNLICYRPVLDDLRAAMREVHEDYGEWAEAALDGSAWISHERGPAATAKTIRFRLADIHKKM